MIGQRVAERPGVAKKQGDACGAKGPYRRNVESEEGGPLGGNAPPDKLSELRQKPGQKAKQEPEVPVLRAVRPDLSGRCAECGDGTSAQQRRAPGIDGVTFEQIEKQEGGRERMAGRASRGTINRETPGTPK